MPHPPLFLAADHNGFPLKEQLVPKLRALGLDVTDLSPALVKNDDYPLAARALVTKMKKAPNARGILVCGSGVGMAIAANRAKGIRAFTAHSEEETKLARNDNDANVIALSGWNMTGEDALRHIQIFLKTPFSKAARHHRRVEQLG